jgi:hypothetical protein
MLFVCSYRTRLTWPHLFLDPLRAVAWSCRHHLASLVLLSAYVLLSPTRCFARLFCDLEAGPVQRTMTKRKQDAVTDKVSKTLCFSVFWGERHTFPFTFECYVTVQATKRARTSSDEPAPPTTSSGAADAAPPDALTTPPSAVTSSASSSSSAASTSATHSSFSMRSPPSTGAPASAIARLSPV